MLIEEEELKNLSMKEINHALHCMDLKITTPEFK
jgi:hypothetical protein